MTTTLRPAASGPYRGRFAPTPSGPLHLGSLLTALASYLDARHRHGSWLLRIDDLDQPRCPPGADQRVLAQLEAHGLHWDETPRYQSRHLPEYQHWLSVLQNTGHVYACGCTRAALTQRNRRGVDGPVYAGTCRALGLDANDHALRFGVGAGTLELHDDIQGALRRDMADDIGDFVVQRRDGIIGYQLASAVDDHLQQITDVVRGADLIGSSVAQLRLFQRFGWPPPQYRHVPVLTGDDGLKLSKQNHAQAIDVRHASDNLWRCLQWLGQRPPALLRGAAPTELLHWAIHHWRRERIMRAASLSVEPPG